MTAGAGPRGDVTIPTPFQFEVQASKERGHGIKPHRTESNAGLHALLTEGRDVTVEAILEAKGPCLKRRRKGGWRQPACLNRT